MIADDDGHSTVQLPAAVSDEEVIQTARPRGGSTRNAPKEATAVNHVREAW